MANIKLINNLKEKINKEKQETKMPESYFDQKK